MCKQKLSAPDSGLGDTGRASLTVVKVRAQKLLESQMGKITRILLTHILITAVWKTHRGCAKINAKCLLTTSRPARNGKGQIFLSRAAM